jgi:hypothetical protein
MIVKQCPKDPTKKDVYVMRNGREVLWMCGNKEVEYKVEF